MLRIILAFVVACALLAGGGYYGWYFATQRAQQQVPLVLGEWLGGAVNVGEMKAEPDALKVKLRLQQVVFTSTPDAAGRVLEVAIPALDYEGGFLNTRRSALMLQGKVTATVRHHSKVLAQYQLAAQGVSIHILPETGKTQVAWEKLTLTQGNQTLGQAASGDALLAWQNGVAQVDASLHRIGWERGLLDNVSVQADMPNMASLPQLMPVLTAMTQAERLAVWQGLLRTWQAQGTQLHILEGSMRAGEKSLLTEGKVKLDRRGRLQGELALSVSAREVLDDALRVSFVLGTQDLSRSLGLVQVKGDRNTKPPFVYNAVFDNGDVRLNGIQVGVMPTVADMLARKEGYLAEETLDLPAEVPLFGPEDFGEPEPFDAEE
ncbi:MAG: DUF2125 domain-containing protein [Alphaproteobacteria bacterium]